MLKLIISITGGWMWTPAPSCGQKLNTQPSVPRGSVLPHLIPSDGIYSDKTSRDAFIVAISTDTFWFSSCVCIWIWQPVWQSRINTGPDFVFPDHTAQLVCPQFKWRPRQERCPRRPAINTNKQINNCKRPTVHSTKLTPVKSTENKNWADV